MMHLDKLSGAPEAQKCLFFGGGAGNLVRCGLELRIKGSENPSFTVSFECLLPVPPFLSVMCERSWFHFYFTRACQAWEWRIEYHKVQEGLREWFY